MWTIIGAIATVVGIVPLLWKAPDVYRADVVVDRISGDEVILANRSQYADANNVRIVIAGRGDTDFELGDPPGRLEYDSIRWRGNNGSIPPQGEMRLDLEECRPDFNWLPGQVEIKTVWEDGLSSWVPGTIYAPFNKRRFNRNKIY